jgi:hypothetical protein
VLETEMIYESLTEHKDEHDKDKESENETAWKAIIPPLSSEVSSDSATVMGFHFSLPTSAELLRPVTCTTPPPIRSWQQEVLPTTVCETPGMSTQGKILMMMNG